MDLSIGSIFKIRGNRWLAENFGEQIGQIVKWTSTQFSDDFRAQMKLLQIAIISNSNLEYVVACSALLQEATPIEVEKFKLNLSQTRPIAPLW